MTREEKFLPGPAKRRVFLVDDHPIVRQGLTQLFNREADLTVCGEAGQAQNAVGVTTATKPDILVLDISLDGPDGLDLLKEVRERIPDLPVLVLSMHDESIYAERALRAGANGYIMKHEDAEKVLMALRRILNREMYVSDRIAERMLRQYIGRAAGVNRSPVEGLTDRELEVFRMIGEGYGTRQIAEKLHLSVKTVETYQAHIKEKMSFRSARQLVQHAVLWVLAEKGQASAAS
jgi:DNA-binding NarL/FixJ family response regulator